MAKESVEPWLRGTHTEVDAVRRQVLHALELAEEDCTRCCSGLTDAEVNARPFGISPIAFQLRHIARSLDRLLTYAEMGALDEVQLTALRGELEPGALLQELLPELQAGLVRARERVLAMPPEIFGEPRFVGRDRLATTLGGLVVHCAEHTQRHVGQVVTTARVLQGMRA